MASISLLCASRGSSGQASRYFYSWLTQMLGSVLKMDLLLSSVCSAILKQYFNSVDHRPNNHGSGNSWLCLHDCVHGQKYNCGHGEGGCQLHRKIIQIVEISDSFSTLCSRFAILVSAREYSRGRRTVKVSHEVRTAIVPSFGAQWAGNRNESYEGIPCEGVTYRITKRIKKKQTQDKYGSGFWPWISTVQKCRKNSCIEYPCSWTKHTFVSAILGLDPFNNHHR
mmetsp:Transcript_29397/g.71640  ORF Transcript_29397/g.71640 Transcript_29397/m.71640 type:complete len:225 (-) Transcript_29397:177-851(-)